MSELMTDAANSPQGDSGQQSGQSNATDAAAVLYGDGQNGQQATDTQGQTQPADGQGDGTSKPGEGDNKPAEGAPEKYEFKAPDGTEYDADVLAVFETEAKKLNLNQEQAQGFLDALNTKISEHQNTRLEAAKAEWADSSKFDKEFGGDKFDANLAVATKAIEQFGTPELRELLDKTGLGNHPEMIRAFYRAGKAISQDRVVTSSVGARPGTNESLASRLYPNQ